MDLSRTYGVAAVVCVASRGCLRADDRAGALLAGAPRLCGVSVSFVLEQSQQGMLTSCSEVDAIRVDVIIGGNEKGAGKSQDCCSEGNHCELRKVWRDDASGLEVAGTPIG